MMKSALKPYVRVSREVLQFIGEFKDMYGYAPTLQEIAEAMSVGRHAEYSRQWASRIIRKLREEGKVQSDPTKRRSIVLVR